ALVATSGDTQLDHAAWRQHHCLWSIQATAREIYGAVFVVAYALLLQPTKARCSRVRISEFSRFPCTLGIRTRDPAVSGLPQGHYRGLALSWRHDSMSSRACV